MKSRAPSIVWFYRAMGGTEPTPHQALLFRVPYSLFPIPYSLFPIPYSLIPGNEVMPRTLSPHKLLAAIPQPNKIDSFQQIFSPA